MKKRLRKKLHKNEFTEYGLKIDVQFFELNQNEVFTLFESFADLLENNNLYFGGSMGKSDLTGTVELTYTNTKLEEVKKIVWAFFKKNNITISKFTSDIIDLWYPDRIISFQEKIKLGHITI